MQEPVELEQAFTHWQVNCHVSESRKRLLKRFFIEKCRHTHTLDKHTYLNRSDLEALSIRKMNRPTSVFKEKETTLLSVMIKPWEGESRL